MVFQFRVVALSLKCFSTIPFGSRNERQLKPLRAPDIDPAHEDD
jgi:hypothetical protein